ncbi:IspD/TarI family cytidylyltransferase [soil metagenome]
MSDRVAAVLLAGGSGIRFGARISKVYAPLGGRPLLAHSLQALGDHPDVDDVVVVIRDGDGPDYGEVAVLAPTAKVRAVVTGGASRQASEWAGIAAVRDLTPAVGLVMLHDAARPFLSRRLISDLVGTARGTRAGALPAQPLDGDLADAGGQRVRTADLVAVQTPQVFPLDALLSVYPRAMADGFDGVDTAQTMQAYSDIEVHCTAGGPRNLKVTHAVDLALAESLLPLWSAGGWIDEPADSGA